MVGSNTFQIYLHLIGVQEKFPIELGFHLRNINGFTPQPGNAPPTRQKSAGDGPVNKRTILSCSWSIRAYARMRRGDMQVHTHVAVMNLVETPSGQAGGLDLAQLEGRIHEWGALYQAYLASNLRIHGVRVDLDERTELARLSAIPDHVVAHFSRRTLNGTDAARAYARSHGLDWDTLGTDQQVGLLKSGVQNRGEGKADDVGDLETWRRMAASLR